MESLVCHRPSSFPSGSELLQWGPVADKYLMDESRRRGSAAALALPKTRAEVCAVLREASERGLPVTVSGARTGIAAGAVPQEGIVLSLERMNRIRGLRTDEDGTVLVRCEAGVPLSDLQRQLGTRSFADSATWDEASLQCLRELLEAPPLFHPPDPTETGASIGGTVACDASGAHSFRYGPTRPHVRRIVLALADGSELDLSREQCHADEQGHFLLQRTDGTAREAKVPLYARPATKNVVGYHSGTGMDLIDLFIGSEGTLGVLTEVELALSPLPEKQCGVTLFCPSEDAAIRLTQLLRDERSDLGIEAIEYLDADALDMLRRHREAIGAGSGVPDCLPTNAQCALHLDLGLSDDGLPVGLERIAAVARAQGAAPERCWTALDARERERLRVFRHAVPECVNARIAEIQKHHPEIAKLGTDMAVPDRHLPEIMSTYREGLARTGLTSAVFGHIGDNHLHVNIVPNDPSEYERGKQLYREFARRVVELEGSVAAEHGVGKLKTEFAAMMLGEQGLREMRAVKALFDPAGILGPGTLLRTSHGLTPEAQNS